MKPTRLLDQPHWESRVVHSLSRGPRVGGTVLGVWGTVVPVLTATPFQQAMLNFGGDAGVGTGPTEGGNAAGRTL